MAAPDSDPVSSTSSSVPRRGQARTLAVEGVHRASLLLVWALLFVVFALLSGSFLTSGTLQTIFGSQEVLVFIAMGAMCAFAVGEFDLSVASVAGLSATLLPVLVTNDHVAVWLACVLSLAAAAAVGAANALIIVRFGINPIITTLGMATLLTGVAERLSNEGIVSITSSGLQAASSTNVLGLPINFYYGVLLTAVLGYVFTATPLGRHMRFVGSNRSVARLALVNVNRIRAGAYIASASLCGLGGVLLVGTVGGFDPSTASSYLLPALAATFLGTAVIQPGRFNPFGTLIAIYFLTTGIVGLQILGAGDWVSDVFYGAALIIAIAASTMLRAKRTQT